MNATQRQRQLCRVKALAADILARKLITATTRPPMSLPFSPAGLDEWFRATAEQAESLFRQLFTNSP